MSGPGGCDETTKVKASTSEEGLDKKELRIWIGNLDLKLSEYQLLKLVQRYGEIEHFDFLFHRSGPYSGQPRGYAFVTFKDSEAALSCLKKLDGKRVLEKNISVRWAHQSPTEIINEEERIKRKLPALGMKAEDRPVSKEKAINAIEAKLRAMEKEHLSFKLTSIGKGKGEERKKKPYERNLKS